MPTNGNTKWLKLAGLILPILVAGMIALRYFIMTETAAQYLSQQQAAKEYVTKLELSEKLTIISNSQAQMTEQLKNIASRLDDALRAKR